MDANLAELISGTVNTRAKLDILHYFHRNPYTWESLEGLAQRLYRPTSDIQAAVASLTRQDILEARSSGRSGGDTVYSYCRANPQAAPLTALMVAYRGAKADEVLAAVNAADAESRARALARKRSLDDLKTRFVSMVTHELRTPVTALRSILTTLLTHSEADPERCRPMLDRAVSQCDRLTILIENLLVLSGIQDGGHLDLYLSDLDTRQLVQEVVRHYQREELPQHVVCLFDEAPDTLVADEYLLSQALSELVGNAVKFSPPDGTITVAVSAGEGQAIFRVTDEGVGISLRDRERIFDEFYQAEEDASRRTAGLGLGLFMARQIVERHGGQIWLADDDHPGTTVCFCLPLAGPTDHP